MDKDQELYQAVENLKSKGEYPKDNDLLRRMRDMYKAIADNAVYVKVYQLVWENAYSEYRRIEEIIAARNEAEERRQAEERIKIDWSSSPANCVVAICKDDAVFWLDAKNEGRVDVIRSGRKNKMVTSRFLGDLNQAVDYYKRQGYTIKYYRD